jgi:site-specific recombinase XerD
MKIYNSSGKDLALTQRSLLHASIATTQIYIGVENEKLEEILRANNSIVNLEED